VRIPDSKCTTKYAFAEYFGKMSFVNVGLIQNFGCFLSQSIALLLGKTKVYL